MTVLDFDRLTNSSGEWLKGVGPESDVVVSSRIRLARNLDRFPFPPQATDPIRAEVEALLRGPVAEVLPPGSMGYVRIDLPHRLPRRAEARMELYPPRDHSTPSTRTPGGRGQSLREDRDQNRRLYRARTLWRISHRYGTLVGWRTRRRTRLCTDQ